MSEKTILLIMMRESLDAAKKAVDTAIELKEKYKEKYGEEWYFPCLVGVTPCTLEELRHALVFFISMLDNAINKGDRE